MNRRALGLAVGALGLAGVVVWDYWPKASPVPAVQVVKAPSQGVALLNPLSQRAMGDFKSLFDHPLFDPSRTPPAAAVEMPDVPVTLEIAAVISAEPSPSPKLVLMGTVTSPLPGGAFLGDDAGGPVVFLRPGQAAQGLTLQQVLDESALFQGPDGVVTLPLQDTTAPEITPTMPTTLPNP
jgi:hypothetical protein